MKLERNKMNEKIKKTRRKMTVEEKKIRKEKKRRLEINIELSKYYSILGFHRIFDIEGDEDKSIRNTEVDFANKKIAEIEAKL
jgi:hypothetical protein